MARDLEGRPVTPAEELAEAADKLEALTTKVVDGPWRDMQMGSEGSIVLAGGNTVSTSRRVAMTREFAEAEYIAAMSPLVGKALVAVFREWVLVARFGEEHLHRCGGMETLTLARLINGSAS